MHVNCRNAQPHLGDLARGTPATGRLASVKAHLDGCPACSVAFERTRRLQSLLSLKRHESPDELIARNFLPEFHRRLYASLTRRRSFLSRMRSFFEAEEGLPVLARGLAFASAVFLSLFSLYTAHLSMQTGSTTVVVQSSNARPSATMKEVAFERFSGQHPAVYVLDRVSYAPRMDETSVLSF